MSRSRFLSGMVAFAVSSLGLPAVAASTPTPSSCAKLIADSFGRAGSGPRIKGFACKLAEDPLSWQSQEIAWTVPPKVKGAEFLVFGGSAAATGHGGEVDAALPLTPGETLTLLLGIDGGASSVSRGGGPLIVAAGSDGQQPSYVSPDARNVAVRAPGLPAPPYPQHGSVYVTWLQGGAGSQVPGDCVVPRLRGKSPVAAREVLVRHHCRAGSISRALARPADRGLVTGQSPKPGSVMPAKSKVDLRVGRGAGSQ